MKLLITPTSPYARKARIAILEKRLAVEEVIANPWDDDKAVIKNNPLRKVPVLLTDDGNTIFDSRVICEFLDAQNDSPRLLPTGETERARVKTREALADGAVDAAVTIIMSKRVAPDMQNDAWEAWLLKKTDGALNTFDKMTAERDADALDLGDIALGCLLGFMDFRFPQTDWRADRPTLADWHKRVSARESFQQTVPRA